MAAVSGLIWCITTEISKLQNGLYGFSAIDAQVSLSSPLQGWYWKSWHEQFSEMPENSWFPYTVGTICSLVYEPSFANTVIQDGGLRELIRCHEKDYLGN